MARILIQMCLSSCVVFFCIASSLADGPPNFCTEVGESCDTNSDCCSSCCTCGLCLKSCASYDNPCNSVDCGSGSYCVLEQATCIQAPCEPDPACMPGENDPCASVRCESGFRCEAKQVQCSAPHCYPIPECVLDVSPSPCAEAQCPTDTQCVIVKDIGSNTTACVPIHYGEGCKSK